MANKKKTKVQRPKTDNKKVVQRLVHRNKVDIRKAEGWKAIGEYKHKKFPGETDLIMMEKNV